MPSVIYSLKYSIITFSFVMFSNKFVTWLMITSWTPQANEARSKILCYFRSQIPYDHSCHDPWSFNTDVVDSELCSLLDKFVTINVCWQCAHGAESMGTSDQKCWSYINGLSSLSTNDGRQGGRESDVASCKLFKWWECITRAAWSTL